MPAISPGRARRVFWLGLVVSVLLHLSLLIPEGIHPPVWKQSDESAPIKARLVLSVDLIGQAVSVEVDAADVRAY